MNKIAQLPGPERAEIFAETAARKDLPEALIEKDFWVCWVLKQLFSTDAFAERLLFKGGTSLSKVFHAIHRFSEDIDLAVNYAALGFTGLQDPHAEGLSRTRQGKILAAMTAECQRYIRSEFLEQLHAQCSELLGADSGWKLDVDKDDPHIVRFLYPAGSAPKVGYVAPQVILELGTHAGFIPRDHFVIHSFVAEEFPNFFPDPGVQVIALLAKRTFWEKVTILHAEYHRPLDKPLPGRYSRHYYDVAMLARGPVKTEAIANLDMLTEVIRHKQTFYPSRWSRYDLAVPGTLRVVPADERLNALRRDYRAMAVMIFGEPPAFESLMETLHALESELNSLAKP